MKITYVILKVLLHFNTRKLKKKKICNSVKTIRNEMSKNTYRNLTRFLEIFLNDNIFYFIKVEFDDHKKKIRDAKLKFSPQIFFIIFFL